MPTALALSPHLDDAAFSCGGTLSLLAARGWRVVMATVFTASVPDPTGFALACQLDKGLGPQVDYMALRRDEDRAAAAALGIAPPVLLPFPEAPHRGYHSAPALFADPLPDDGIEEPVSEALAELIAIKRPDLLLAPQAIGGHVDHLKLVAALRLLGPAPPTLWWRDFPYTLRGTAPREPLAADFEAMPEREVALDEASMRARRAACAAYRSQLGFQFGGEAGLDEKLGRSGPVERFRVAGEAGVLMAANLFPAADG